MRNKTSNMIWGIAFIVVGILYIGNSFFDWNFHFWNWWPLLIIIPSIASLVKKGIRFSSLIWLTLGIAFLLVSLDIISGDTVSKLIVPVLFILVGICIIFRDSFSSQKPSREAEEKIFSGSEPEYTAVFSSNKSIYPNAKFEGTQINSIFGSVELDLRAAIITEDVVINCTSIFAGVDIFVPAGINVKVSSIPIFGGVSNKIKDIAEPGAPTIFLNATCMFGGIDLK